VDYPLELDIYDLCSEDLRKKLEAPRQVYTTIYFFGLIIFRWLTISTDSYLFQKLRDIEGQKLGLQASAKSSSKGDDVKMTDAEVQNMCSY